MNYHELTQPIIAIIIIIYKIIHKSKNEYEMRFYTVHPIPILLFLVVNIV